MKSILKKIAFGLLTFMLVSFIGTNAYAEHGVIEGNESFDKAYHFGHWQYKNGIVKIPSGQDEAYFSFTISQGEQIMITVGYENAFQGMNVELLNENNIPIETSDHPVQPSFTQFIFVKCDGNSINQRFYFKITRGNNFSGDMYMPIGFQNRMSSNNQTFTFSGIARNSGNSMYNYSGNDSSELIMDLSNNGNIPHGAKVTSVTTSSRMYPYQGNVKHFVSVDNTWYPSRFNNANSGMYYISLDNDINVANLWRFKYNTMATSPSKMSNVRLSISYVFDITEGAEYQ